jgi:hypothetical protein
MPALDFKSFLAGFATQAQKIEEESAKIGRELIEEAIEDFREQAKDYKTKKDGEIKEYDELARRLLPMLGNDHVKVKMVLQEGKGEALNFIQKAESTAARKGFKTTADLITYTEDQLKSMGGKDISAFDFIRSGGVPSVVTAPPRLDMSEFAKVKTGVFGRQISPEAPDRISRISETYIGEQKVPTTGVPKADLTNLYDLKERAQDFTPSATRGLRKDVVRTLSAGSPAASAIQFDNNNDPIYSDENSAALNVIQGHANLIMDLVEKQRRDAEDKDLAYTQTDILDLTRNFMLGKNETGEISSEDLQKFYTLPSNLEQYFTMYPDSGNTAQSNNANAQQPQTQSAQTQSAQAGAGSVSQDILSSTQYQTIVNPPSNSSFAGMAKFSRRKALITLLEQLGVSTSVATSHAQQAIK